MLIKAEHTALFLVSLLINKKSYRSKSLAPFGSLFEATLAFSMATIFLPPSLLVKQEWNKITKETTSSRETLVALVALFSRVVFVFQRKKFENKIIFFSKIKFWQNPPILGYQGYHWN
jgi:hypothetical protein